MLGTYGGKFYKPDRIKTRESWQKENCQLLAFLPALAFYRGAESPKPDTTRPDNHMGREFGAERGSLWTASTTTQSGIVGHPIGLSRNRAAFPPFSRVFRTRPFSGDVIS